MQQRNFFRVQLQLKVFMKKIFYNKDNNRYYLEKNWNLLKTKDISANGMFIFYKNLKTTIDEENYLLIKFTIPELLLEDIYLIAKVVRKLEEGFAVNYILINDFDRDKLVNSFLKIEHEKFTKELL